MTSPSVATTLACCLCKPVPNEHENAGVHRVLDHNVRCLAHAGNSLSVMWPIAP